MPRRPPLGAVDRSFPPPPSLESATEGRMTRHTVQLIAAIGAGGVSLVLPLDFPLRGAH